MFATDSAGVKVWEASYLPFGGVQASTGSNSELRFPGQWFQSESGLHQNWMREYDPTLGRYIQADPLGLVDGASVYGYALQNPGRYVDPRGEFAGGVPSINFGLGEIVGDGCSIGFGIEDGESTDDLIPAGWFDQLRKPLTSIIQNRGLGGGGGPRGAGNYGGRGAGSNKFPSKPGGASQMIKDFNSKVDPKTVRQVDKDVRVGKDKSDSTITWTGRTRSTDGRPTLEARRTGRPKPFGKTRYDP